MEQNKEIKQYTPVGTGSEESIHEERIYSVLENILLQQHEQEKDIKHGYYHDHFEFMESLDHVVNDQFSAIRNDKISITELTTRINRWFVFCDAVANLGVSCLYNKNNANNNDYAKMFGGLRINSAFTSTYLKPKGIVVEFRHKSKEARENFPWLAMPCLVIVDNKGTEHEVAITPTSGASVWWLDILTSFHNTYNWNMDPTHIGIDENGKMMLDMSHDHHVDSPFADDDMPPIDMEYDVDLKTTLTTTPEITEAGEHISKGGTPVPTEESSKVVMKPEYEFSQTDFAKYDMGKRDEKHYWALNPQRVTLWQRIRAIGPKLKELFISLMSK